jgi:hypothetical protein
MSPSCAVWSEELIYPLRPKMAKVELEDEFRELASHLLALLPSSNAQVTPKIRHMGDATGNDAC